MSAIASGADRGLAKALGLHAVTACEVRAVSVTAVDHVTALLATTRQWCPPRPSELGTAAAFHGANTLVTD